MEVAQLPAVVVVGGSLEGGSLAAGAGAGRCRCWCGCRCGCVLVLVLVLVRVLVLVLAQARGVENEETLGTVTPTEAQE